MDLFLVGLGSASAAEVNALLCAGDFDGSLIRDWSHMTEDDTFWGVLEGASHERFLSGDADEIGFEVRGIMPLSDAPDDPPAYVVSGVEAHMTMGGRQELFESDKKGPCIECGGIGEHRPNCSRRH